MNIVLVHGILGFQQRCGIFYFRDVAQHFQAKGIRVVAPELDPTRGIQVRAGELQNKVAASFSNGTLDPVGVTHVIAHSMGGLDSRYMLSPANPNPPTFRVRSLTTISTPHRGSPIADLISGVGVLAPFPHLPFGGVDFLTVALDALNISLDGLHDLTTAACASFSQKFVDNPTVAYFSVGGTGRRQFPETCTALLLLHKYIAALTGEANDGLVTLSSAAWPAVCNQTWDTDHAEEVGYNFDNLLLPPAFPYLAKYDQIIETIRNLV